MILSWWNGQQTMFHHLCQYQSGIDSRLLRLSPPPSREAYHARYAPPLRASHSGLAFWPLPVDLVRFEGMRPEN
ncbi:MAG: hypothetical protein ACRBDI_07280 [Alphaproteobacteria bacterium]